MKFDQNNVYDFGGMKKKNKTSSSSAGQLNDHQNDCRQVLSVLFYFCIILKIHFIDVVVFFWVEFLINSTSIPPFASWFFFPVGLLQIGRETLQNIAKSQNRKQQQWRNDEENSVNNWQWFMNCAPRLIAVFENDSSLRETVSSPSDASAQQRTSASEA